MIQTTFIILHFGASNLQLAQCFFYLVTIAARLKTTLPQGKKAYFAMYVFGRGLYKVRLEKNDTVCHLGTMIIDLNKKKISSNI